VPSYSDSERVLKLNPSISVVLLKNDPKLAGKRLKNLDIKAF